MQYLPFTAWLTLLSIMPSGTSSGTIAANDRISSFSYGWIILIYIIYSGFSPKVVSDSLRLHRLPTRLLCPRDFPGNSTGVGSHFLLQGIFLSQGSNPCLLHWQMDSSPLSHQGSHTHTHTHTHTHVRQLLYPFISFDGHVGCFRVLIVVNNVALNTGCRYLF